MRRPVINTGLFFYRQVTYNNKMITSSCQHAHNENHIISLFPAAVCELQN
jgi:hypothetical protein